MFSNPTMKQKLIGGGILAVMLLVIAFYGYTKLNEGDEEITADSQDFIATNEEKSKVENQVVEEVKEEKIIVHITGQIKKSGILKLPVGSRIADAISAAGGQTEKADLDQVNLAYQLQDGQKIYIPSKEEKNKEMVYITSGSGNNVIVEENNRQGVSKKVNINQIRSWWTSAISTADGV